MESAPGSSPKLRPLAPTVMKHVRTSAPSRTCAEARNLASVLAAALSSAPALVKGARQRSPTTARPHAAENLSNL